MSQFSEFAYQNLKQECSRVLKLLAKAQTQFEDRHLTNKHNQWISIDYVNDVRQFYRILEVCQQDIVFHLKNMDLDFLGNLIQIISLFYLLQINFLLQCFVCETQNDQIQTVYIPKIVEKNSVKQQVFAKVEIKDNKDKSYNTNTKPIMEFGNFQNFQMLVSQLLKEKSKVERLRESKTHHTIRELSQSIEQQKQMTFQLSKDPYNDDNYLKFFDGDEVVQEVTKKMQQNIKIRKSEYTEKLIKKIIDHYHEELVTKILDNQQNKTDKETQTSFIDENKEQDLSAKIFSLETDLQRKLQQINELNNGIRQNNEELLKQKNMITQIKQHIIKKKYKIRLLKTEILYRDEIINELQQVNQKNIWVKKDEQQTKKNDQKLYDILRAQSLHETKKLPIIQNAQISSETKYSKFLQSNKRRSLSNMISRQEQNIQTQNTNPQATHQSSQQNTQVQELIEEINKGIKTSANKDQEQKEDSVQNISIKQSQKQKLQMKKIFDCFLNSKQKDQALIQLNQLLFSKNQKQMIPEKVRIYEKFVLHNQFNHFSLLINKIIEEHKQCQPQPCKHFDFFFQLINFKPI